ncbi:hypothetical protein HPP92_012147 [Vanilla planifolia]|uniref:Uncharacterized protein n=1 Tax=Vanilla planifolia TaxID=51239 RepID=A0A835R5J3_VANPL|nr:hypothetical protein HPP92_012147 [Vanilla planifolia]
MLRYACDVCNAESVPENKMKISNQLQEEYNFFREEGSEEEHSESENTNDGDSSSGQLESRGKKKHCHRHTRHQIKQMELFFKSCSHPDDEQRRELGRRLGLDALQVKFWFQNKRTQTKSTREEENHKLRIENESLQQENAKYREALKSAFCPSCGGAPTIHDSSMSEHQLLLENGRMKKEIKRMSSIAAVNFGKSVESSASSLGQLGESKEVEMPSKNVEMDTPMMVESAMVAMDEFVVVARIEQPLWLPTGGGLTEVLNEEYYLKRFRKAIHPRMDGMKTEATCETTILCMDINEFLQILMEVNHWRAYFSGIVSRAKTMEVLSHGIAGSFNGALQVMSAEYQLPSPLVPTRESTFLRYCKQHPEGTWAVVDVSINIPGSNAACNCRRRPSGCFIHELPDGYLKVRWVEHMEVDDSSVHNLYRAMVNCGLAFGAKRWVAALERQNERLQVVTTNTSLVANPCLLKLAERMFISFCAGMTCSVDHDWVIEPTNGANDVKLASKKVIDEPGTPCGFVMSASTSIWLPVTPKRVFEYLQNEASRNEWDILSNGGTTKEIVRILNGQQEGNCISLLAVSGLNPETNGTSEMMIIQEGCSDATGGYVIYAPVSFSAMSMVLQGSDPNLVSLLPSGFAIAPDGPYGSRGSLLTLSFQILVDSSLDSTAVDLSWVKTFISLLSCTAERIQSALV